jgi:hypothetical protein
MKSLKKWDVSKWNDKIADSVISQITAERKFKKILSKGKKRVRLNVIESSDSE